MAGIATSRTLAVPMAGGVDAGRRAHHFRRLDWRASQRLGRRDRRVRWKKGPWPGQFWTAEPWTQLPEEITGRRVEIVVARPGFRIQKLVLVTPLLDAQTDSAEALGQLYFRRWAVKLFFRDIKTTPGREVLRCQTPAMVRKEIVMHAIADNLIRALMQDIAHSYQVPLQRRSFKGTVDARRTSGGDFSIKASPTIRGSTAPTAPNRAQ